MNRRMERDIIPTTSTEIWCDGSAETGGHPRVFLHIESETGLVVCPYCSRTWQQVEGGHSAHA
ncbi:MAG: zinc-finger domain-containing protein [Alphaproteobacteria bacterium]|nr:zinc-finger domain-containing protein [Alphaproteobacteria bacterium]